MRDFVRIAELFEQAQRDTGDAHILFTGDLIHGPHLEREDWPDFLGEYYRDASMDVVDGFVELRKRYPTRVHALMGNHEHAHVGGPHTAKFAPDEVELLESIIGPHAAARLRSVLRELPLAAVAPCGVVFTHGAPAAEIDSIKEVEQVDLEGFSEDSPLDVFEVPVIGALLWARSAERSIARRFLRAMGGAVSVYGHDVIPEGFERIGDEQMIVSTSFGVSDTNKVYLQLDLAGRYETVFDLREGYEILPLYPEAAARRASGTR
jgi:Calcineurin-like phosphoesterase